MSRPADPARPARRDAAFGILVAVLAAGVLWLVIAALYVVLTR